MGSLIIGDHTYGTVARRGNMNNVTIGKYCSIAINVVVDSGFNHNSEWLSTYPFNSQKGYPVPHNAICKGDIKIGNDVWICENVLIMGGVTIGDGSIIGANSIVTKDVLSYSIVAGSPAKKIKERFDLETTRLLRKICWWDWPENHIEKASEFLMSSNIDGLINYYNQNIK